MSGSASAGRRCKHFHIHGLHVSRLGCSHLTRAKLTLDGGRLLPQLLGKAEMRQVEAGFPDTQCAPSPWPAQPRRPSPPAGRAAPRACPERQPEEGAGRHRVPPTAACQTLRPASRPAGPRPQARRPGPRAAIGVGEAAAASHWLEQLSGKPRPRPRPGEPPRWTRRLWGLRRRWRRAESCAPRASCSGRGEVRGGEVRGGAAGGSGKGRAPGPPRRRVSRGRWNWGAWGRGEERERRVWGARGPFAGGIMEGPRLCGGAPGAHACGVWECGS